jgi:hypothetical protein
MVHEIDEVARVTFARLHPYRISEAVARRDAVQPFKEIS